MASRPKITNRTTSLAAIFVQAIIPYSGKGPEDGLSVAGIPNGECAYCGDRSSDKDHFFAIVKNKRPSGFFHGPKNHVPSCGRCNQSKGGRNWEAWMRGGARNSPKTRNVPDLEERITRLKRFEEWGKLKPISEADLAAAVGQVKWDAYWERLEEIKRLMSAAQIEADEIREILQNKFGSSEEEGLDPNENHPTTSTSRAG